MERIILDTDIGSDVDDAMALALALCSPEIRIEAVTTVYGDTALRALIAARIIQLAGREDIPIYSGLRSPLLGKRPVVWFGNEGEGILNLRAGMVLVRDGRAVDVIISTIMSSPHAITLVAIGPLTNVAAAIIVEPSVAERVKRIIVMGGAAGCAGGASPKDIVEHNFKCDPEAAAVVMSSGSPITLVGLDVTRRVIFEHHHLRRLRDSGGRLRELLVHLVEKWWETRGFTASNLHDPLALGLTIEPGFVTTKRMNIWVDYQSNDLAGAMFVRESAEATVDVSIDVKPDQFLEFMLARICGA